MERFRKALTAPGSDRISVRMAIAQLMAHRVKRTMRGAQIALALMEAETGETAAGDRRATTFRQRISSAALHDYQLSQTYLERARAAGASETSVRHRDGQQLPGDRRHGTRRGRAGRHRSGCRQRSRLSVLAGAGEYLSPGAPNDQALTAFAQASDAAGDDPTAEQQPADGRRERRSAHQSDRQPAFGFFRATHF